jgi:hypothetical protein
MTRDLNDSLDDIFGAPTGEVRTAPVRENAVSFKSAETRFEETCPKCRGTGRFVSYTGRPLGECFACKGAGKRTFKNSSADRAKARGQAAARKARTDEETLADFAKAHPEAHAWLVTTAPRWEVARSLLGAVVQYGSLTEKQMGIVTRGIDRDAVYAANKAEHAAARAADAPAVDTAGIDRLKAAFDQAVAYTAEKGLKLSPRITIGGMTISPAKANSANPGALYVKQSGGERIYLGKIAGGRFLAAPMCTPADAAKVQQFVADPAEAAKVYGQTTGTCCICNATLRSEWKHRGIGPICAQKFGW